MSDPFQNVVPPEDGAILRRIDPLWLFVSEGEFGEGMLAIPAPNGQLVPMMAADEKRVESFRAYAQAIASHEGVKVKLVKFTVREDVEIFGGKDASA